jgi:hypothetical protein
MVKLALLAGDGDEIPSLRERRIEQALVDRALVDVPTADAPRARELLLAQIGQERRLEARLGRALTETTVRWIDWFRGQGWARRLPADECRARGSTEEGRKGRGTERSTRTGRPERCEHAAAVLRAIEVCSPKPLSISSKRER